MIISKSVVEKLNPCKKEFDDAIRHYGDQEFTPKEFLKLDKISHQNKLWVAFRLMDPSDVPLAAADIAESVLHLFEEEFPNDNRPRKAIEAARGSSESSESSAWGSANTAMVAAEAAAAESAIAAARAEESAWAVLWAAAAEAAAAWEAARAAIATSRAAAESTARAAVWAAGYENQEGIQIKIVLKYLEKR